MARDFIDAGTEGAGEKDASASQLAELLARVKAILDLGAGNEVAAWAEAILARLTALEAAGEPLDPGLFAVFLAEAVALDRTVGAARPDLGALEAFLPGGDAHRNVFQGPGEANTRGLADLAALRTWQASRTEIGPDAAQTIAAVAPGATVSGPAMAFRPPATETSPYAIHLALVPSDSLFANQWHLNNTGQSGGLAGVDLDILGIWDEYSGAGVTVGVWDDGVQIAHPDLAANYDASLHPTFGGTVHNPDPENPGSAHGTAVAGVIAAAANGSGTVGSAFGATIAGVDIFYDSVHDFSAYAAMTSATDESDITNRSWGFTTPFADNLQSTATFWTTFFGGLVEATTSGRGGLGSITMVAGGNDRGDGRDINDSNFSAMPETIAVAAVGHDGYVSWYSTPGAALLVAGPTNGPIGSGVWTTDRTGADGYSDGLNETGNTSADYTAFFGGTSSATPAVSGVVALMLEANPALGWRDVQEILSLSARHTGSAIGTGPTGTELYTLVIQRRRQLERRRPALLQRLRLRPRLGA